MGKRKKKNSKKNPKVVIMATSNIKNSSSSSSNDSSERNIDSKDGSFLLDEHTVSSSANSISSDDSSISGLKKFKLIPTPILQPLSSYETLSSFDTSSYPIKKNSIRQRVKDYTSWFRVLFGELLEYAYVYFNVIVNTIVDKINYFTVWLYVHIPDFNAASFEGIMVCRPDILPRLKRFTLFASYYYELLNYKTQSHQIIKGTRKKIGKIFNKYIEVYHRAPYKTSFYSSFIALSLIPLAIFTTIMSVVTILWVLFYFGLFIMTTFLCLLFIVPLLIFSIICACGVVFLGFLSNCTFKMCHKLYELNIDLFWNKSNKISNLTPSVRDSLVSGINSSKSVSLNLNANIRKAIQEIKLFVRSLVGSILGIFTSTNSFVFVNSNANKNDKRL